MLVQGSSYPKFKELYRIWREQFENQYKRHKKSQVVQAALSPLEYFRRAFVALFNLQKYLLHFEAASSKALLVDLSITTMVGSSVTTIFVCFEMDGDVGMDQWRCGD